jgi:hypothetical protein
LQYHGHIRRVTKPPPRETNMLKMFFIAVLIISFTSIMTFVIASEGEQNEPAVSTQPTNEIPSQGATDKSAGSDEENLSVMDLPVNFSTPEDVEKTFQLIEEQAGESRLRGLKMAMGYIMTYDLSVGHNKEKMYKKLNGRTPNQIISQAKPR